MSMWRFGRGTGLGGNRGIERGFSRIGGERSRRSSASCCAGFGFPWVSERFSLVCSANLLYS